MFKDSFKYYKSRKDPPDLRNVVDFDLPISDETAIRIPITFTPSALAARRPDCLPPHRWRVYELRHRPGLIFVRNPFTAAGQRYWMSRSLRDYPRPPHAVNLSAADMAASDDAGSDKGNSTTAFDWWQQLQRLERCRDGETADQRRKRLRLRSAMRWATLGYQHDWDTKVYSERKRQPFPRDLALLSAYVCRVLALSGGGDGESGDCGAYEAKAAIVNFYPQGSTLAGHTDHSEKELAAPLFSFSFGQTAIFLIGGPTVDEKPTAVFLRSGDIAVMSRQSRLSYHAVPRILHGAASAAWDIGDNGDLGDEESVEIDGIEPHAKRKKTEMTADAIGEELEMDRQLWLDVGDADVWQPFDEYVRECRININVRRVLKIGASGLDDE